MVRFIAEMRNEDKVVLCEGNYIGLYQQLMSYFDESANISRFYIEKNNNIIEEKWLRPKEQPKILRRRKEC